MFKTRKNRGIADCPPYTNRTVRHSKPTARNAINVCQSRPLLRIEDCPRPRDGPSAVQKLHDSERQTFLDKLKKRGGPSAPNGRTVRPSLRENYQNHRVPVEKKMLVGGPSARPPLAFSTQNQPKSPFFSKTLLALMHATKV